jgi:hypothetical protein
MADQAIQETIARNPSAQHGTALGDIAISSIKNGDRTGHGTSHLNEFHIPNSFTAKDQCRLDCGGALVGVSARDAAC